MLETIIYQLPYFICWYFSLEKAGFTHTASKQTTPLCGFAGVLLLERKQYDPAWELLA